jgi:surfeit locus 1 family protein
VTARNRIGVPLALSLAASAVLMALGVWQIRRLAWKEALIARVDARVAAAPVDAPGPQAWRGLTRDNSEYRHVVLHGAFESGRTTLVKAVTDYGGGYWAMTPFVDARGFAVLVNRGFVATRAAGLWPPPGGQREITGLVRISEPGGAFLRANDPAANRWFSRDVAAIARERGLVNAAPYFVDEARGAGSPDPKVAPVGGLTVIRFPNNHLVYAITWFSLAALAAFGAARLIRERIGAKSSE